MSSESLKPLAPEQPKARTRRPADGAGAAPADSDEMRSRRVTDPRAMRAIAHPVRLALLEALAHVGTLTATQASDRLGESPANCAFHLRTLAKYGFVEEAGGGRGRERPWRRVHEAWDISPDSGDPASELAAAELSEFWLETILGRARVAVSRSGSWPAEWRDVGLGASEHLTYLTPEEARKLVADAHRLLQRYAARADHPERRPPGAMPVELLFLRYPLLHLADPSGPVPGAAPDGRPLG